jgi:hypothetical protein
MCLNRRYNWQLLPDHKLIFITNHINNLVFYHETFPVFVLPKTAISKCSVRATLASPWQCRFGQRMQWEHTGTKAVKEPGGWPATWLWNERNDLWLKVRKRISARIKRFRKLMIYLMNRIIILIILSSLGTVHRMMSHRQLSSYLQLALIP